MNCYQFQVHLKLPRFEVGDGVFVHGVSVGGQGGTGGGQRCHGFSGGGIDRGGRGGSHVDGFAEALVQQKVKKKLKMASFLL